MTAQTQPIQLIALNNLVASPRNVRKQDRKADIDALAASIAAHGLLQNLCVVPTADDKYEVDAGGRRLAALKQLAKQKVIAKGNGQEKTCGVPGNRFARPRFPHQAEAFAARDGELHVPDRLQALAVARQDRLLQGEGQVEARNLHRRGGFVAAHPLPQPMGLHVDARAKPAAARENGRNRRQARRKPQRYP